MEGGAPLYFLRSFHAVARLHSFTQAGRELHLSQPSVSAHVRALERHYRARLFEVRHRRVCLTPEGEALLAYTQRVFNLLHEAGRAVAAVQAGDQGRLSFGASDTIAGYLVPAVLRRYAATYPQVEVTAAVGSSTQIVRWVLAEELPFGLVEATVEHPDLLVQPIGYDDLVLIVPPDHPLVGRTVPAAALQGTVLLRREADSGTQAQVDLALGAVNLAMPTAMRLGSSEALKRAVMGGLGLAWVPRLSVAQELATSLVGAVTVDGLEIRRTLSRIHRRGARLNRPAELFLEMLRPSSTTLTPSHG